MGTRRFLITGGLGYVGAALISRIQRDTPCNICVLDIDVHERAHLFANNSSCEVCFADVLDPIAVERAIRKARPHFIYHLAARHYIPDCLNDPIGALALNVSGTLNVLRALRRINNSCLKAFVFASSAAVYKDLGQVRIRETDPVAPLDIYGHSKLLAEQAVLQHSAIPSVIARIFNVYGGDDPVAHVIPSLCKQIVRDEYPVRVGTLRTVRDFVHIADVSNALFLLRNIERSRCPKIYNIGTGEGVSGAQILATLEWLIGKPILHCEDGNLVRDIDRRCLVACASALRKDYNWTPTISLYEGLRDILVHSGLVRLS